MKTDLIYLRHILDAALKIESYVSVGRETFMRESHWQEAVIRQLEVIGEATKRISRDFVPVILRLLGEGSLVCGMYRFMTT